MKSYHYYQYNPEDVDNFAKSAGLSAIFLRKNKEHSDSWTAPFISWSIVLAHLLSAILALTESPYTILPFSRSRIGIIVTKQYLRQQSMYRA